MVDEFSFATAESGRSASDEEFVGLQFRCYSRSHLLTQQGGARLDPEAARVKHYQLVTSDDVIDVVTTEAPDVVIRTMVSK